MTLCRESLLDTLFAGFQFRETLSIGGKDSHRKWEREGILVLALTRLARRHWRIVTSDVEGGCGSIDSEFVTLELAWKKTGLG